MPRLRDATRVHVGDWEHGTVRLGWAWNGQWSQPPKQINIQAHDFGSAHDWDQVTKEWGHPVVYSARGSHGSWK